MSQDDSQEDGHMCKENGKRNTSEPMQEILPRLYLGDLKAAENIEDLRSSNISLVLSIKGKNLLPATREAYQKARISHIHICKQDCDQEDLLSILEPVCDMIEGRLAKNRAVLVHCALGKSRSATVVIAYVMRHLNMSYQEAKVFVRTKRAAVSPKSAFCEQLVVWEKCNFDLQNRLMVEQEPGSDPVGLECTFGGKEPMAEGEERIKEKARSSQEKEEEKGKAKEVDEEEEEEGKSGDNEEGHEQEKGDEEGKDEEKQKTREEDVGKEEEKTDTSPSAHNPVKDQESQNVNNHSAVDGTCRGIDIAPSPTHETVRAAIKSLYLKYPAMGKKKLLRILNNHQGWSIGSKEFRSHLEAIVDEWSPNIR